MTTSAIVGGFTFKRQHTSGSPLTYVDVPEVINISGIGAANDLVDATHFGSGGSREYVGGLADGQEVTVECNYVANSVQQEAFITGVALKKTGNFQVIVTGASPNVSFTFAAAYISWSVNPSVDDRDTLTFTIKISGAVTVA
jgi:hypothetical protein